MRHNVFGLEAEKFIDVAEDRIRYLERDIRQYHAALLDTQVELESGPVDGSRIFETTCRYRGLFVDPLDTRYFRVYEY